MANPFETEQRAVEQAVAASQFTRATVEFVPNNDGQTPHIVTVSPRGESTTEPAVVAVDTVGDVALPREGDHVLLAQLDSELAVVVGTLYVADRERPPDYRAGDRVVSGDRSVRLTTPTGDVTIREDGTVVVGADDPADATAAIVDASVSTTTDSSGNVTDVSLDLTQSDSVYLTE